MSEAITKTATGACAEISERGDWTTFHVDTGGQYPVKLATKKQEIIELGRAASKSGEVFDWTYNEVESDKINERSGKPFLNRYLEAVAPAGSAPVPETRTASREYAPDLKDRMIVRQTALKAAAEIVAPRAATAAHPDFDAALETMKAAQRFETWVYRDIDPVPFAPELSEHDEQIPYGD